MAVCFVQPTFYDPIRRRQLSFCGHFGSRQIVRLKQRCYRYDVWIKSISKSKMALRIEAGILFKTPDRRQRIIHLCSSSAKWQRPPAAEKGRRAG